MTKIKFLSELNDRLSGLPKDDIEERLSFYSEMIEDRMEDGLSEEEAVAAVGSVDEIAAQIIAEIPLVKVAKERIKPKRRLRAWEIVLLALGSPLWLSLLIVVFAVILSAFVVVWSVIAALWSVFAAFVGVFAGGIAAGVLFIVLGKIPVGIAMIGIGVTSAGLAIFAFFGCIAATKGVLWLVKRTALGIKFCFVGKEKVNA
jgi:uncharacterized membrane protein